MSINYKPLKIRVDDNESQEQQVTLNGVTLFFRFTYSTAYTRDNWILDVLDRERNNLLVGKRITATTNLTYHSLALTEILNGYCYCVNTSGTRKPMDRNNFNSEAEFRIWYVSNEEIASATESS